jgi:hypothetical protein
MRRRTRATPPLDKDLEKAANDALRQLDIKMSGFSAEITGAPTVTIKLKDGSFRKKPLAPNQELIYAGAYLGKSGKPIFNFKPFDAQDYDQVEFNSVEINTYFPQFADQASMTLGIAAKGIGSLLDRLVKNVLEDVDRQKREEAEAAANDARITYKDHPLFGRF